MKYVQSFYQYPVTYSSIGKGIPAKDAIGELRNIAAFEDAEIETLKAAEPMFNDLVNMKKYRILDKLPESYKPSATLINEAHEENERLKAELAALKAKNAESADGKSGEKTPETGGDTPVDADKTPEGDEPSANPDLSKMEYKELQEYASKLGIEKVSNVKKADLIKAIEDAQNGAKD